MIGIGIIGCGSLGAAHAKILSGIKGARLIGYADVHAPAAQNLLERHGGSYATVEADRIFGDPSVDAVYICTRHDSHADLCIRAAAAGKHLFVEKPLALNYKDCEAVATAVAKAGITFMPAFKMRYYPLVRRAKEFIPRPQVIVAHMMDQRWGDERWAQDPVQGGGNVYSQGCHTTDLLRYFAGSEPRRLWASGGNMTHPEHPFPDQCVASIQFEGGRCASWVQGDAGLGAYTSKFFFGLHCDSRSVQLSDRCRRATFTEGTKSWTEEFYDNDEFTAENEDFIAALLEKRTPALGVFDGVQAARITFAAERAIRTGEVQILSEAMNGGPQPGRC